MPWRRIGIRALRVIWIGTNEANSRKVLAALNDFGMGSLGISLADLTQAGQVIQRATRRDALIC
jgi:hypothetical protein